MDLDTLSDIQYVGAIPYSHLHHDITMYVQKLENGNMYAN